MKNIKLVEFSTIGKRIEQSKNEDGFFVTQHFVGVIDGVSSQSTFEINGKSTGAFIKDCIQEAFKTMPPNVTLNSCIKHLNKYISPKYKDFNVYRDIKSDIAKMPGACLLVYSASRHEIGLVGDGTAKVGDLLIENPLEVDKENIKIRQILINRYLDTGSTVEELTNNDLSFSSLKPLFIQQINYRNVDTGSKYNFSVIDGINIPPKRLMKVHKLSPTDKTVILATDGYPKVLDTLEETEEYLLYVKKEDPLCINIFQAVRSMPPSLNNYDDRTYIRFEIV